MPGDYSIGILRLNVIFNLFADVWVTATEVKDVLAVPVSIDKQLYTRLLPHYNFYDFCVSAIRSTLQDIILSEIELFKNFVHHAFSRVDLLVKGHEKADHRNTGVFDGHM